jgi:hypothetical protein
MTAPGTVVSGMGIQNTKEEQRCYVHPQGNSPDAHRPGGQGGVMYPTR